MTALNPHQMLTGIKSFTGMSEVALAAKLAVSQPTVNRILNGQCNCSSVTLLSILRLHGEMEDGKLQRAEPVKEPAAA